MVIFQSLLLVGLGFCLGRLFKCLDEERKAVLDLHNPPTVQQMMRIIHKGYHLLIIAVAIVFLFLFVQIIGPYLQ